MRIALAGYTKQEKLELGATYDEDADLLEFLQAKGLDIASTVWNDENVDWNNFDVVIIKSTWDYYEELAEFLEWLDQLEKLNIKVANPVETIKWNSHKKYLQDISDQGLPIIPVEYLEKGAAFDSRFFDYFGTDKLVVKPCVSAGAQNTIIVKRDNYHERIDDVDELLRSADYIVQPFVEEVKNGEWSFLFFNGKYSHCTLKTPKQGDFRVQHHHGGSISYPPSDPFHVEQAKAYLKTVPQATLYARVDGIILDNTFKLMEMELIEPYLFLNSDKNLLENYYQALIDFLEANFVV